jgi:LPXTG-motif cell wall-anchored protein
MASRDLGIIPKIERKDTRMLCLEGCPLTGPDAWDIEHADRSSHDSDRCLRAAISMIVAYYGGNLSQDRLSYYAYAEYPNDELPEHDLGHGKGLRNISAKDLLEWALIGSSVGRLTGKPDFETIEYYIDSGYPILRDNGEEHWITVIDGYDIEGQMVHVIEPLNATESKISYENLDVFVMWVALGDNIRGRSDEPTIWMDTDGDGIVDFDETNRFHTDPHKADTDGDGIDDKTEIRSYTFLANGLFDSLDTRKTDADKDGLRAELDPDSDNDGIPDGSEDLNHNGIVDPSETDPFIPEPAPGIPINTWAPWIGLTLIMAVGVSIVYFRRRKKIQRRERRKKRQTR